jgi:hypothetical protein
MNHELVDLLSMSSRVHGPVGLDLGLVSPPWESDRIIQLIEKVKYIKLYSN